MKHLLVLSSALVLISLAACSPATVAPATASALPATGTPRPPTDTRVPATDTPVPATPTVPPTATPEGSIMDNLDTFDPFIFSFSSGYANGNPFNNGWRADHISFTGGIMTITLDNQNCPGACSSKPYASGEYRTAKNFGFGRVEARFKAASARGVMSGSIFTYTGPSDKQPWDEVDIEILGKDPTKMQTNYITNGVGGHETIINLGFDASKDFHTYAFEWTATSIKWYVDDLLVHTETGSRGALPTHPSKIMLNLWPGIGEESWLGTFNYSGPLQFQVDWIKYTPLP